MNKSAMSIGVVIPTLNASATIERCLAPLLASSLELKILVIDSSSDDDTVAIAKRLGAETVVISKKSFNHGSTRERARKLLGTDIVVMMTPDAILQNPAMIEYLVAPIQGGEASLTYGRQIPHEGADIFEAYPREFNYPAESHIRSMEDADEWGVYLFFNSDSFAAYSQAALDEIGGFDSVLTAEDAVAAAKLLRRGHSIAYVAEAVVAHSHKYTLVQEFRRCFDTGLMRKQHHYLFDFGSHDAGRGWAFALAFFRATARQSPYALPYAFFNVLSKYLGYLIGAHSLNTPQRWKRLLGMQGFYWISDDYVKKGRPSLREKELPL